MIRHATLLEALDAAARSHHGVRFLDRHERPRLLSYAELRSRACAVAGGLQELGTAHGDRVAIVLPTSPAYYDAFFGTLLAGCVPVPLYPPFRLGRLQEYHEDTARMLSSVGARAVLTSPGVRRLLGRSIERARPALGCRLVDELPRREPRIVEVDPEELALVQFSSGTTREPKPVALTHAQVLANVGAVLAIILTTSPDTNELPNAGLCWLPLYHDMGLIGCVLTALARPAALTLMPPELFVARPAAWLRAISTYRATVSPAPNFAYRYCAERIHDEELAGVDLSCWRFALNGAEPVTPDSLRSFVERFAACGFREEALTPVYGLAEAGLAVTFSDPRRRFTTATFDEAGLLHGVARPSERGRELVSVGRPLAGFAVRVTDGRGREQRPGRIGRIRVRGPSVMSGYLAGTEFTGPALCDGWLDTGDNGFLHDGELFVYGRAKDLVIVRGCNYAPQQIEAAVEDVEGVRPGCSVAAGALLEGGEALVLLVERHRSADPRNDAERASRIRQRVLDVLGILPERVELLEPGTLPRTSSGKLRRTEALRRYLAGELQPPRRVGMLSLAKELLRSSRALSRSKG